MLTTLARNLHALLNVCIAVAAFSSTAHAAQPLATVPFVGCPADGQLGPMAAPKGEPRQFAIPQSVAAHLAWYQFDVDGSPEIGILAPRGWNCFGTYGSNGSTIYVAPDALNADKLIFGKQWHGFTGPALELSLRLGGTSGRFEVAKIAARVFPHYRPFVKKVIAEDLEPASNFHFGPFSADRLTYKSNHLVEFTTPANSIGLGTQSWLTKGPGDITGFACIGGEDTDVLLLTMRLPPTRAALSPIIIHQAEREASNHDH